MVKIFNRGRLDDRDDSVRIDEGDAHDWWAGREGLATPIDRRWRRETPGGRWPFRRADDRPPEASPDDPGPNWSTESLYTWSATSGPADEVTDTPAGTAIAPWSVLGLTSDASWSEVVRAHRRLAKTHHPDRHVGDPVARRDAEERMVEINAAFHDLGRIYRLTEDR